jgi:hypothetical protein
MMGASVIHNHGGLMGPATQVQRATPTPVVPAPAANTAPFFSAPGLERLGLDLGAGACTTGLNTASFGSRPSFGAPHAAAPVAAA